MEENKQEKNQILDNPRLILLGKTGAGKSTLLNHLFNHPLNEHGKPQFIASDSLTSCTYKCHVNLLNMGTEDMNQNIVAIDTPGFGDNRPIDR